MSHQYWVRHSLIGGCKASTAGFRRVCSSKNRKARQEYCEAEFPKLKLDMPEYTLPRLEARHD